MEEVKAKRVERECVDKIIARQGILLPLLKAWRSTYSPTEVLPRYPDIVHMTPFSMIIQNPDNGELYEDSYVDAVAQSPRLCAEWRDEKGEVLLSLFPAPAVTERAVLELATTVFSCDSCI